MERPKTPGKNRPPSTSLKSPHKPQTNEQGPGQIQNRVSAQSAYLQSQMQTSNIQKQKHINCTASNDNSLEDTDPDEFTHKPHVLDLALRLKFCPMSALKPFQHGTSRLLNRVLSNAQHATSRPLLATADHSSTVPSSSSSVLNSSRGSTKVNCATTESTNSGNHLSPEEIERLVKASNSAEDIIW